MVNRHPVSCEYVPLSFSLLGREMVNLEAQSDSYLGGTKKKDEQKGKVHMEKGDSNRIVEL